VGVVAVRDVVAYALKNTHKRVVSRPRCEHISTDSGER
jgi:hypothetical protein